MKETVLQIMPAPDDLRIWLDTGDGKKTKCKPLCIALVRVIPEYEHEGDFDYEDIRYVDIDNDGNAEFFSGQELEFVGVSFDNYVYETEPMTDEEKKRYEMKKNLKYPKR